MAKADQQDMKTSVKKIEAPLIKLNALVNDLLDSASSSNTNKRDREISAMSKEVDDVIFQEIKGLTQFTGDDISTFLVKHFNDQENGQHAANSVNDIEDIFENESSGAFSFFQDRYKNQNLLFEDLNSITSQLSELREAIYSTRDAIVASDDMSHTVSRSITFKNTTTNDGNKESYVGIVESMEKEFKLLSKLKNHIVPNTLQYGKYYVYTVPYSNLFQKHYEKQQKDEMKNKRSLNEATSVALESVDEAFATDFRKENDLDKKIQPREIASAFNGIMENIEVVNDDIGIPLLEGTDITNLFDSPAFKKRVEKAKKKSQKGPQSMSNDGTVDMNNKKNKDSDFSSFKECYIKLIDPRKIIPVKIMEEVIGYYYIHETQLKTTKSPFTTSIKLSPTGHSNPKDVETAFLSKITEKIVKGFNKSYLENNSKFKELILNSLIYNDVYKKELKFQFIPVDYITEFAVNQDEEGNGTSIIMPALFYAKLYLALLIFKMITVVTKSNDQKVYYVKNSGLDNNVANSIQNVARSIKEKNINFMDLMNYNSLVSKVGAAKDIFMPIGRSGEKGIDFDIMSGQDVQLNTELMDMLKSSYITSSGVPSVMMNYINEADYARTLVMANAKFASRVVNHQMDFNPSVTEMYKKILNFSTDIPPEAIDELEFTLSTPKALDTTNMTDLINNTDQVINYMIKAVTGEQSSQSEDDNIMKDILYRKFSKELLPMLPWDNADKIYEEAEIELAKIKAKAPEESAE